MVLKILPNDVRSMLCASSQINNCKKAVEELVCNSLDAKSTSIAIRVHIQECRIQVVDNGYGISKNDFDVLGQRYLTSKLPDISTLRSIPKYYGYRGEFLANIIEISENVKITSRHKDGEETWSKVFCKGRIVKVTEMASRPSKGTTVDISGFLYNLNIQKQGINTVNDLQNIKSYLEQLSLVHNTISLSLRDDSKNDIIFKIHKKRDIYQTLSTLFNIEKSMIQELQIEKNQYKVKGLIGKSETDIEKHWVFLNGKFINKGSKLHKTVDGFLKKYIGIHNKKITKSKNNHENQVLKKHIPFYFVFVMCPYIDYDLSSTLRQPLLQFKNWDLIKIMLEKLVKFYVGDIKLIEIKKPLNGLESKRAIHKDVNNNRNQIKKIIDRILGKNLKTSEPLPLQNGVKGEFIKRKKKKRLKHKNKRPGSHATITNQRNVLKEIQDNNKHAISSLSNYLNNEVSQKPETINTNNGNNSNNKDKNYLRNIVDNVQGTANNSSKYKLTKHVNTTFILKDKKKKLEKIHKNMSQKKKVNQKIKYPTLFLSNCGISKEGKEPELFNISELIKKTKPIFPEDDQMAKDRAFLKENNDIQNATQYKEQNFISRINDHSNRNRRFKNPCGYNLDDIPPKKKTKPIQTTYDLLNTILKTPDGNNLNINFETEALKQNSSFYNEIKHSMAIKPHNISSCNFVATDSQNHDISDTNKISDNITHCNLRCEYSFCTNQFTNVQNRSDDFFKKPFINHSKLNLGDIFEKDSNIYTTTVQSNCLSYNQALSALTYKSHIYDTNIEEHYHSNYQKQFTNKSITTRFITEQSRDNFTISKSQRKGVQNNYLKSKNHGGLHMFYKKSMKHNITVNKSYTIEYTSDKVCSSEKSKGGTSKGYYVGSKTHYTHETQMLNYEPVSDFGNTYTVSNHHSSSEYNMHEIYDAPCAKYNKLLANESSMKQNCNTYTNLPDEQIKNKDKVNFVFVSDIQDDHENNISQELIEPLDVCETVYFTNNNKQDISSGSNGKLNEIRGDTMHENYNNNVSNRDTNKIEITELQNKNRDDVSHHFSNTLKEKCQKTVNEIDCNISREPNLYQNIDDISNNQNLACDNIEWSENNAINHFPKNNFDLKDRLRFIPKAGMSQIFDKCGTKTACDYNLEEEYYSNVLYNDFANDVQMQSEIYEPKIQNVAEFSTKDINKFTNKIHKENTSLSFDERSLKEAQILNQVDSKFIAATIKEKYTTSGNPSEFLVLFDQHAVDERIRLEKNLADYFIDNKWTSTALDNINLKLSRDEIIYLHNYKDKFNLLGLQWNTVNDDEIILNSIPEAILGKSPREVDKVMKAVKNLIVEEINIIKLQKGCISLYPKSIMDLVFSEACRYAIKFGDKLSKNDCIQLIKDLSNCKTPFQCAHGRPVMAVLFEIKNDMHTYKIDTANLHKFKSKC